MPQICLDTDFLVGVLRGDVDAGKKAAELAEKSLACSAMSAIELFVGANLRKDKPKSVELVNILLGKLNLLEINREISEKAGAIKAQLITTGQQVSLADVIIAATCLEHNMPIVTRNVKHFSKIRGLKVEEW